MKINGRKNIPPVGPLGPTSSPAPAQAGQESQPVQAEDRVELTSAPQVGELSRIAQALPSVRVEKVADLRGEIEGGNYWVESDKLARKVVDEALSDALIDKQCEPDPSQG
jgi:negative regulator of flagellin synthesis FlgM